MKTSISALPRCWRGCGGAAARAREGGGSLPLQCHIWETAQLVRVLHVRPKLELGMQQPQTW
jgi:hypothetical protein